MRNLRDDVVVGIIGAAVLLSPVVAYLVYDLWEFDLLFLY